MKKKVLIFGVFLSFILFCLLIVLNYKTIRYIIPDSIKNNLPKSILNFHEKIMIPLEQTINSVRNPNYLYNAVFLPETHFASMNLKRFSFKNKDNVKDDIFDNTLTKYYVDHDNEKIIITTYEANIFYFPVEQLNDNTELILSKIDSNLQQLKPDVFILDTLVDNGYIYVSGFQFSEKDGKNCKKFRLYKAKLNKKKIKFEEIYNNNQCAFAIFMQAGRIQMYSLNDTHGILFSMGENEIDKPNQFPQDDLSDYGKFIYLDLLTNETQVFSKGHRNPQGLVVTDKIIISTEHGPQGGDEINKIEKDKNYGWPISSYGIYYNTDKKKYLKSHRKYNFKEPIFTYIPAIGISEIISLPEKFLGNEDLDNLYFVSSLNGKSLFLVKFSNNYEKLIFSEKILINQRIRDLKYIEKYNSVILALEHPPQLAIIKSNNN